MKTRRVKAVALFSGGLDSTLAILVMKSHGVEVEAIKFLTHFGCDANNSSSCGSDPSLAANQFGFPVRLCHLGQKFIDMVKKPQFGYGKNMNPCIDCRILMLREAKDYLEMTDADFIITGEVLAQRPMSQMRGTLNLIDRESSLGGRLLRPLSGKLLPPTKPEMDGLIQRDWLLDISGRSRRRQIDLAAEFGLTGYPNPAGGCLLTEKAYSKKLRDLFTFVEEPGFDDFNLLKVGRHFRLAHDCRLVIGRNQPENQILLKNIRPGDRVLEAVNIASPIGLLRGNPLQKNIELAAAITARYSDARQQPKATVKIKGDGAPEQLLEVSPASNEILEKYRI
jgi:tRNA U34 2-thiouridine synthase MnmA/TrmU